MTPAPPTNTLEAPAPPLPKLLGSVFSLAAPTVLQNLLESGVTLVDALMLALLPDNKVALAVTALTGIVLWRLVAVSACIQHGTGAFVSRRWGESDFERAGRAVSHAILIASCIGVVVACVAAPLARWIHASLGATGEVLETALKFFYCFLPGIPFQLAMVASFSGMRAAGDTRTPLFIAIFVNLLNLAGNYILIFGHLGAPALGVRGAAVASAISLAMGAILAVSLLARGIRPRRLIQSNEGAPIADVTEGEVDSQRMHLVAAPKADHGTLRFQVSGLRAWIPGITPTILRVSWPSLWEEVLVSIGFISFIGMITHCGTDALAAHSVCTRIESISYTAGYGVAVATAAMIGQSLGARRIMLARRLLGVNLVVAMSIMGVMGMVYCLFPGWFLQWFHLEPHLTSTAIMMMLILGFEQPFIGSTMTLAGGLRGAGDTVPPFLVQLVGTIGMRIGAGWLLAFHFGLGVVGIYWATVLDWFMRTLVLWAFVASGRWTRTRV